MEKNRYGIEKADGISSNININYDNCIYAYKYNINNIIITYRIINNKFGIRLKKIYEDE